MIEFFNQIKRKRHKKLLTKKKIKMNSVEYDEVNKIWSSVSSSSSSNNNLENLNINIGEYVLKRLNELNPNKIIEINHDTGEELTVADYKKLSITCAINLLKLNIKKGDIILYFCIMNSLTTVSVYGCYYVGAIVHPVDVNCTEDDFEYSLSITNPTMVLCDDNVYEKVQNVVKKFQPKNLKYVFPFGMTKHEGANIGQTVKDVLFKPIDNTNEIDNFKISPDLLNDPEKLICYLLSSSGTTGRPKLSIIPHLLLLRGSLVWWNPNESSRVFCASLFRWISQAAMIIQCVHYGFCRVITGKPSSGEETAKIIDKYKITHLFGLPTLIIDTFEYVKKHELDISSLQMVITGGESTPDYLKVIGKSIVPQCKIFKCYGMTEMGRCLSSAEHVSEKDDEKNTVGYLTEDLHAKICDIEGNRLGPNQKGQICFKAKYIFLGYLNGDRKTQEAFDSDGWFLTGDFGYFDEKNLLYVVDRYKDIISFDGTLIFPNPIERTLEKHPAVMKCMIVGIPHEKGQMPVAFVRIKAEFEKTAILRDELKNYLRTRIESNQYPSGGIYFVDEFPLTFTGKIFRERLKIIAQDLIENCNKNELK